MGVKKDFNKGLALLSLADRNLDTFADKDLMERIYSLERDLIDRHTSSEDLEQVRKIEETMCEAVKENEIKLRKSEKVS